MTASAENLIVSCATGPHARLIAIAFPSGDQAGALRSSHFGGSILPQLGPSRVSPLPPAVIVHTSHRLMQRSNASFEPSADQSGWSSTVPELGRVSCCSVAPLGAIAKTARVVWAV